MSLTPPPTAPDIADQSTFQARSQAMVLWYATAIAELDAIIGTTIPAGSAAANTLTGTTIAANVTNMGGLKTLASGQLAFPAVQIPSADPNTLDDYEEGVWTPSVGGSATYTTQDGSYVKIGKLVIFQGRLTINAIGSGSVNTIDGLPFTVGSQPQAGWVGYFGNLANNVVFLSAFINSAATTVTLSSTAVAAGTANLSATILGSSAQVYFGGAYMT